MASERERCSSWMTYLPVVLSPVYDPIALAWRRRTDPFMLCAADTRAAAFCRFLPSRRVWQSHIFRTVGGVFFMEGIPMVEKLNRIFFVLGGQQSVTRLVPSGVGVGLFTRTHAFVLFPLFVRTLACVSQSYPGGGLPVYFEFFIHLWL